MPPADDALSNAIPQQPGNAEPASGLEPNAPRHTFDIPNETEDADPDVAALRLAESQARVEAGGDPAGGTTEQANEEGAQQRDQAPQAPATTAMIPKPRLDQALAQKDELAQKVDAQAAELAYLRGRLDQMAVSGGTQGATPGAPAANEPAAPQQDPREARLAQLRTQIVEVEQAFQDTGLTVAERAERLADIQDEMTTLRADLIVEKRMGKQVPSMMDEALEQRHTAQLDADNPHLTQLSDAQMAHLSRMAHLEAELQGNPYRENSVADNMRLRESIARLSLAYEGHWWKREQSSGGGGQPQPTPPGKQISANAAARAAKVALANDLPPDVRNLGRTTDPTDSGGVNESTINGMSDVEIERMMSRMKPEELSRLLN